MKKLFTFYEIYDICLKFFRGIIRFIKSKKNGIMNEKLQERIMLAVTGVNKCSMCSYAHTKTAFEAGLSDNEIKAYLDTDFTNVPTNEAKAILFAQHYADTRGKVSKSSWDELVKEYGIEKAEAILSAIRAIMLGNATGIPAGSFINRIKGKKSDNRSSLVYELTVFILLIPILLFSLLHAIILNLFGVSILKF
ncbi:carboxymuconolactone decarboxylase family protein [Oceanivirga salmonicida]|uniref:carboxymuconolactone decarboxylase family protein n=1 Tax=Oceanivirga salmonicida TaxID=1769291 RepID=UPI00082FC008|nr:carboxymuconolactone decarboxylase family protein [Oceanivirga salmonicida]